MASGQSAYEYRGPLSTSGIENLRNGGFRGARAAWRVEIGNEGWNWPIGDPNTTGLDYIYGTNVSGTNNNDPKVLGNADYQTTVNDMLIGQVRMAFLVEQVANPDNRIQLALPPQSNASYYDNLGIPRPLISYQLDAYTQAGFSAAREAAGNIYAKLGGTEYTTFSSASAAQFEYGGVFYNYKGAGHFCGTHIMGSDKSNSVVNNYEQSWDHPNLYLCGCGSMPSIGIENPTLTMLALACRSVAQIGA